MSVLGEKMYYVHFCKLVRGIFVFKCMKIASRKGKGYVISSNCKDGRK